MADGANVLKTVFETIMFVLEEIKKFFAQLFPQKEENPEA